MRSRKRAAMLSLLLAFFVCVSLVGVTVVPASLMPCCCKFGATLEPSQQQVRACCLAKSGTSSVSGQLVRGSCCGSLKAAAVPSCCAQAALTQECGTCRCLEQAQIVALSGYSVWNASERVDMPSEIPDCARIAVFPDRGTTAATEHSPPGPPLFLKVCTLLI